MSKTQFNYVSLEVFTAIRIHYRSTVSKWSLVFTISIYAQQNYISDTGCATNTAFHSPDEQIFLTNFVEQNPS